MHRDLKPGNVMVSDEGRVKVLDFGLARAPRGPVDAGTATITASPTLEGQVVGTPAYMSPEQAEGRLVDSRSDIFSLGVLFYEMLTGRRPFSGETPTSIIAAIVKDTPRPVAEWNTAIPRELSRVVHRCLAKPAIDRYQSAVDLRHALEDASEDQSESPHGAGSKIASGAVRPTGPRLATIGLATLAAIGLLAAGAGIERFRSRETSDGAAAAPRPGGTVRITSSLLVESYPAWSPDGQRLTYQSNDRVGDILGNSDIWVAQVGGGDPVNLTKDSLANDRRPSWSPDGREIAFYSDRDGAWGVYLMSAIGGSVRKVLPVTLGRSSSAPQWSADGRTLFVAARENDRNVIFQLSLASLQAQRLILPTHDSPQVWDISARPDGSRFAYVEAGGGNPEVGRLWTIAASGGEPVALTDGRHNVANPMWSNDGRRLVYVTNRAGAMDLWEQRVDEAGHAVGDPVPITAGMGITSGAFSADGKRLAFSRAGRVSNVWRVPILADRPATWTDATQITAEHAYIEFVDVSPDGRQLAVSSDRRGNQDLWLLPAAGGEMTQLTDDPTPDWNPRWSPDGKEIAFYAYRSGNRDIWVMPSRGGPARQLTFRPGFDWYPTWRPDGGAIAFRAEQPNASETWIVPAAGGQPRFFAKGAAESWSPDGQWLAGRIGFQLIGIRLDGTTSALLNIPAGAGWSQVARAGDAVYYSSAVDGPIEDYDLWRLSVATGTTSRLTRLAGPRGNLGYYFSADERYLYFLWLEHDGDIFVMDVARAAGK
jgi:Tol biopolymer transport system component